MTYARLVALVHDTFEEVWRQIPEDGYRRFNGKLFVVCSDKIAVIEGRINDNLQSEYQFCLKAPDTFWWLLKITASIKTYFVTSNWMLFNIKHARNGSLWSNVVLKEIIKYKICEHFD